MSAFCVGATHQTHVMVGPQSSVRAIIHVVASGLDEDGLDVSLRLWIPLGVMLVVLRERAPTTTELRGRATALDDRTVQYSAGRWRDGAREYELEIALPAGRVGDQLLAARLDVVAGSEVAARSPIILTWTDDERLLGASRQATIPTGADAIAELPTGPSPKPRHTLTDESPVAGTCPACDLRGSDGDRFCERCGHSLAVTQKS